MAAHHRARFLRQPEFATATAAKGQRPDLTDVLATVEDKRRIASSRALLDSAFP